MKKSKKLGVGTKYRTAVLKSLSIALIQHGQIKTSLKRAKCLRSYIEPLITKAKQPNKYRLLLSKLNNNIQSVNELNKIAEQNLERPGGYTRILKICDSFAYIQLVSFRKDNSDNL